MKVSKAREVLNNERSVHCKDAVVSIAARARVKFANTGTTHAQQLLHQ
jgi:hypothetical protein